MAYSIDQLTTAAECDQVLAYITDELRVLNQRRSEFTYQVDTAANTSAEQTAELESLTAEISFLTPLIPTLPASKKRTERENELRRSTDRRDELLSRQGTRGPVSLLIRELELAQIEAQLTETTALQTSVTTRRAAL